jgi:hypothetical protein
MAKRYTLGCCDVQSEKPLDALLNTKSCLLAVESVHLDG